MNLTDRETQIAALVARGLRNRQIADDLVITERTVRSHLYNIYRKAHVCNRTQLALKFSQQQQARARDLRLRNSLERN